MCELPSKRTFRSDRVFTLLDLRFPPVFWCTSRVAVVEEALLCPVLCACNTDG